MHMQPNSNATLHTTHDGIHTESRVYGINNSQYSMYGSLVDRQQPARLRLTPRWLPLICAHEISHSNKYNIDIPLCWLYYYVYPHDIDFT